MRLLQKTERFELKALASARGLVIDRGVAKKSSAPTWKSIAHLPEALAKNDALILELLESIARLLDGLKPRYARRFYWLNATA